jgi:putative transposase
LVLEQLSIAGLIRTRLARSIADSAWALFATLLGYKAAWYGEQ